jgi:hypothetical protein
MILKLPKHCKVPFYILIASLFLSFVFFFFIRPADKYQIKMDIKLPFYDVHNGAYFPLSYSEARTIIESKAFQDAFITSLKEKYKTNSEILDSINYCAIDIKKCIQILYTIKDESYLSIFIYGRSSEAVFEISKTFQNVVIENLNHLSQLQNKKNISFNSAKPLHEFSAEKKVYISFYYSFLFFIVLFSSIYLTFLFIKKVE